jgi:hypothetical protein
MKTKLLKHVTLALAVMLAPSLALADATISLGKNIDNLTLKGDLRLRYESRHQEKQAPEVNDTRHRMRTRFRLGLVWDNPSENWEVGAGLASGGSSATSTNATWSENDFFETGDLRLDYAYAKHNWDKLTFIAGQQKQPWVTTWLLWDSDIRPIGFTAKYDLSKLFVNAGAYNVRYSTAMKNDMAWLYYGQFGGKFDLGRAGISLAAAYYLYDDVFNDANQPNPKYEYEIGDLNATVDVPVGDVKLSFIGNYFINFGASGDPGQGVLGGTIDPEDQNTAWLLGLNAQMGKFSAKYHYARIEADACVGDLRDQDFGDGLSDTDIKGHLVNIGYKLTKNWKCGATARFYEAIERTGEPEVSLYQVDLVYKF